MKTEVASFFQDRLMSAHPNVIVLGIKTRCLSLGHVYSKGEGTQFAPKWNRSDRYVQMWHFKQIVMTVNASSCLYRGKAGNFRNNLKPKTCFTYLPGPNWQAQKWSRFVFWCTFCIEMQNSAAASGTISACLLASLNCTLLLKRKEETECLA